MGDVDGLTMTVYVTRVHRQGSLTVGFGHDEAGKPAVFAGNSRIMREVQDRLEEGEKSVPVVVEPWQLLAGGGEA